MGGVKETAQTARVLVTEWVTVGKGPKSHIRPEHHIIIVYPKTPFDNAEAIDEARKLYPRGDEFRVLEWGEL